MTENTQMNYRTQVLDAARVFWQQHTQADALSMTMAELHDDVELVIRAARQEIASLKAHPYDQRAMGLCHVCGWKGVIDYPDGPVCVACEHDKTLAPQPTAQPLHVAATSCPHEIDKDKIVLHFDSKQPGKNALAQLAARLQAAHAQAVPAPGVPSTCQHRIVDARNQVIASGYLCVECGALFNAADHGVTAAPAQAGEYQPSSADMVMAALDTEEWGLERIPRCDYISDEGNREGAWLVKRQKAPYCACYTDKPGAPYGPRSWSGPTALDALQKAADDLRIRLPQPAAQEKSVDENDSECEAPPIGWRCTRTRGHDGPCAAVVSPEDRAFVERGMRRIRDAVDAERYRCLRSTRHWIIVDGRGYELLDDGLDSAIDDAIAAQKGNAA